MPPIPILQNIYEGIPYIDRSRIPADQMPAFLHIVQLLADLNFYERNLLLACYLYEYSKTAEWELRDDFRPHGSRELDNWRLAIYGGTRRLDDHLSFWSRG